ncbi:hypothetical protein EH31_12705 [Erythrobacter longus]|uniref:Uncharacterized protein n=1 Tax=Erythrobacter longus TaxID=1044 RepID=A0A074M7W0_ERYLO|nr:hypothetical protein EH31_12705 [Erythrobacter longus]
MRARNASSPTPQLAKSAANPHILPIIRRLHSAYDAGTYDAGTNRPINRGTNQFESGTRNV